MDLQKIKELVKYCNETWIEQLKADEALGKYADKLSASVGRKVEPPNDLVLRLTLQDRVPKEQTPLLKANLANDLLDSLSLQSQFSVDTGELAMQMEIVIINYELRW